MKEINMEFKKLIVFGNGFEPLLSEPKSEVLPIRRPEIFCKDNN